MARRFKETTRRPGADRATTLRRASETSTRGPSRLPSPVSRRPSPLQSRVGAMRPGQGAIDFGRQMTSNPGVQQAVDAIRNRVMANLSQRGIYQDERGTYQIRGMERPDTITPIRDSAVSAMGGQPWLDLVRGADARLRGATPSGGVGLPGGPSTGGVPQPGPSGVPSPAPVGTPRAPVVPQPIPGGTIPTPVRGGVPQPGSLPPQGQRVGSTSAPAPTDPGIWVDMDTKHVTTNTGVYRNGVWSPLPPGSYSDANDPMRRVTLSTQPGLSSPGVQTLPSQGTYGSWPHVGPQPGLSAPASAYPTPAPVPQGRVGVAPSIQPGLSSPGQRVTPGRDLGPQPGLSAPAVAYPPPRSPGSSMPITPTALGAQPSPVALGDQGGGGTNRIGVGPGGQVIGSGVGNEQNIYAMPGITPSPFPPQGQGVGRTTTPTGAQVDPTKYPVTNPNYNPPTSFPSQGQGVGSTSTPVTPGRGTTPVVPPGSLPGQTTPSRPGQMPTTFPNGAPFGTSGSPFGPGFPFNRAPRPGAPGMPGTSGMPDLSQLGAQIQQTVASRVGGIRNQAQGATQVANPAQAALSGLSGLGDRIRQSVMAAQGGTSAIPGVGASPGVSGMDLSGLGGQIMGRVNAQLQQGGLGQGLPITAQPSAAPAPSAAPIPPGGSSVPPVSAAPASTAAPPVSGGTVPQGTIQTQQWGNGVSWSNLGQYDSTIQAAAAKYGIDPAYIYASMAIESGGADVCNPNGVNCHVLQMWPGNAQDAARLGYDINTNEGQIGYFAAIAAGQAGIGTGSTPEERIMSVYPGAGGSAQHIADYDRDWNAIVDQYHAGSQPQTTPAGPPTTPGTQVLPTNAPATAAGPPTGGTQVLPTNPPATAQQTAQSTQIDPATGAPIQATPVTGAGGGQATPGTTPAGPESGAPLPQTGAERYPIVSGGVAPALTPVAAPSGSAQGGSVPQGDGQGVYAGPNADESWMQIMSPDAYVSTEYKQRVDLTYEPGCGCGAAQCSNCSYNSNTLYLAGADNTVHPGYDVGMAPGTEFNAPMGGTIIGTKGNASDPRCMSPGGTNECTWAYDNGIVMDGGTDMNGQPIYINYDHVTGANYADSQQLVGQYVDGGTPLGVVGDAAHIHVEVHGYCDKIGKMVVLDPTLVYSGYYQSHSACEGIA